MSENNFWRYIKNHMKGIGIFTRIENSFFKGIPDVNFLIDGIEGWIELKYREKFPVRTNTPIRLQHFTKEKIYNLLVIWIEKKWRASLVRLGWIKLISRSLLKNYAKIKQVWRIFNS